MSIETSQSEKRSFNFTEPDGAEELAGSPLSQEFIALEPDENRKLRNSIAAKPIAREGIFIPEQSPWENNAGDKDLEEKERLITFALQHDEISPEMNEVNRRALVAIAEAMQRGMGYKPGALESVLYKGNITYTLEAVQAAREILNKIEKGVNAAKDWQP